MDTSHVTSESSSKPQKLLSRVKNCLSDKHYSLRTEKAYVYWIRWYIRFHGLRRPDAVLQNLLTLTFIPLKKNA